MWSRWSCFGGAAGRTVGQGRGQVLVLQHLAELLGAPVGHEELHPRVVALAAVAVVAEDRGDGRPDVGDLVGPDEDADPLGELGVGGQAATDPQVVAGLTGVVDDADEGDVVDLVAGAVVDAARHRRLPLARQVAELGAADVLRDRRVDDAGRVEDLVLEDPGERAAEHDAGGVAAGLRRPQAHGLEPPPDLGDVLDADPVQLHVLPVGHVGDVAAELGADPADHAELLGRQLPAVDADAQHEERVLELLGLQQGGLAARDARGALGVEAHPAHPPPEVTGVDAVEAGLRVDVEDALAHLEAVGVPLRPLVGVERLSVAQGPLTLSTLGTGAGAGGGHGGLLPALAARSAAGRAEGALQIGAQRQLRGDRAQR